MYYIGVTLKKADSSIRQTVVLGLIDVGLNLIKKRGSLYKADIYKADRNFTPKNSTVIIVLHHHVYLDTSLGFCGLFLTFISILLFICTFPLSLFFTLKVCNNILFFNIIHSVSVLQIAFILLEWTLMKLLNLVTKGDLVTNQNNFNPFLCSIYLTGREQS